MLLGICLNLVASRRLLQSSRPFSVFRLEQGLLRLGFQRLDFAPGANEDSVQALASNPEEDGRRSSAAPWPRGTRLATSFAARVRSAWI
jgi:hypothetical protein